jgi:hypothetical protein
MGDDRISDHLLLDHDCHSGDVKRMAQELLELRAELAGLRRDAGGGIRMSASVADLERERAWLMKQPCGRGVMFDQGIFWLSLDEVVALLAPHRLKCEKDFVTEVSEKFKAEAKENLQPRVEVA